jgi:lipopolysaccharide/colanic/teichoic acid biosynthesis glycosyltransferase
MLKRLFATIFSRENLLALLLALIAIALVIFTADTTPDWIYQGF